MNSGLFFLHLARHWFFSKDLLKRLSALLTIAACTASGVYVRVYLTEWHNAFVETLSQYDRAGFFFQLKIFFPIVFVMMFVQALSAYLTAHLGFEWRAHTVRMLQHLWLKNANYYRLSHRHDIDHPDQRLAQDTLIITGASLKLILLFSEKLMTLFAFSYMLWIQSKLLTLSIGAHEYHVPGLLLWIVLIYCALGTSLAMLTGRKIVPLTIEQEKNEASFRYYLIRLIENAQSAAMRRGEAYEARILNQSFAAIEQNFYRLLIEMIKLDTYTQGYITLNAFVPLLLVGPYYFKKLITLGLLMQIKDVFLQVYDALSQLVFNYQEILRTHAALKRVHGFYESVSCVAHDFPFEHHDELKTHNLSILHPNGKTLCTLPDLCIRPGERVWIRGPSGLGKSSFLKTLAGLHPHYRGQLTIPKDAVYLPSGLYLPIGSLRDALSYPHPTPTEKADHIIETLGLAHLRPLLDQEDYHHHLSMGEQQRVALASVLNLDNPSCIFLDEPTSHLNPELKTLALESLFSAHPHAMIIVVSHDAYPPDCFDHIIDLTPADPREDEL